MHFKNLFYVFYLLTFLLISFFSFQKQYSVTKLMIILCVLLILAMKIRYPNYFMPSKLYINGLRKISYFDFHECHLVLWKNRNGKY